MGLFSKKNKKDAIMCDIQLIKESVAQLDILCAMLQQKGELHERFLVVQNTLTFCSASANEKVYDLDKKINNLLGDCKIALQKSKGEFTQDLDKNLKQLNLILVERETFFK